MSSKRAVGGPKAPHSRYRFRGYATPAFLSTERTVAGFIGACRMRTPVASKNAFAIAELIAVVGGSPEPDSSQPLASAAVLPALTSPVSLPGVTTVYLPGWTLISV